jgi:hypothetical protein
VKLISSDENDVVGRGMLVTPKESKFRFVLVTSESSTDKFLSPPITPTKARAVKSFPIGRDWMYEPKWEAIFPKNCQGSDVKRGVADLT